MEQERDGLETIGDKLQTMIDVPTKLSLASSLIVLNFFSSKAQEKELRKKLQSVRETFRANEGAKQELFKYFDAFESTNTQLCPIMVKEYDPASPDEEYTIGMLINGEYHWMHAFKSIREHVKLEPTLSVSFFCGKYIISNGKVSDFYEMHKQPDGILYLLYMKLGSYGGVCKNIDLSSDGLP